MISIKSKMTDEIVRRHAQYMVDFFCGKYIDMNKNENRYEAIEVIEEDPNHEFNYIRDSIIEDILELGNKLVIENGSINDISDCNIITVEPKNMYNVMDKYNRGCGVVFPLEEGALSNRINKLLGYKSFSSKKCSSNIIDKLETRYYQKKLEQCIDASLCVRVMNNFSNYLLLNKSEFTECVKNKICKLNEQINSVINSTVENNFDEKRHDFISLVDKFYNDEIECNRCFTSETYSHTFSSQKKWSAYVYLLELGVNVCPYCNINHINTVFKSTTGTGTRADLDHFLPKSKYPIFSMSIYNLIPSCSICNRSFKKDNDMNNGKAIHPFVSYDEEPFSFDYNYDNIERLFYEGYNTEDLSIILKYNANDEINEMEKTSDDVFCLSYVYQQHKNIVANMLKKQRLLDHTSFSDVEELLDRSLIGIEDSRRMLMDVADDNDEVSDISLGKFKRDIYLSIIEETD